MKLSAVCFLLLLSGSAWSQDPDFGGSDVIFGTEEPDKDAPAETLAPDEKPSLAPTTEEVKPTDPAMGAEITPDMELPVPENCTGVMCDFEAIRQCEAPVIFAKQCCPVCPTLDLCDGVECNDTEVCSVFNGRAVCCTDLSAKRARSHGYGSHGGHHGHRGRRSPSVRDQVNRRISTVLHFGSHHHGHGYYSNAQLHHNKLRCRYDLPDNCTLRFNDEMMKTPTKGPCVNASCNESEACVVKYRHTLVRRFFRMFVVMRKMPHCCKMNRPDCPDVERPTVLGKCHLPGDPIPMKTKECNCTDMPLRRGKRGHGYQIVRHRGYNYLVGRMFGRCSSGSRTETTYQRVPGSVKRCKCECPRHESYGHHSHARRCGKMRLMTNECRTL
ncbi:uncharacterized protein LOC135810359 [Sycon ciliatum]|uniref:uncharacterized protein LOC135810359 n=1 Tax=Sycon ciliatum TaxID=27933 RepID=UPI0031F6078B